MKRAALVIALALPPPAPAAGNDGWVRLPGGEFRSALQYEDSRDVRIAPFQLMETPVTNAEFLAFVRAHPKWRRGRVADTFAEPRYLQHWAGPTTLGPKAAPQQPVVNVSWFAADAYCKAQGARLPSWGEWEYAAAADETRRDARADRVWRERILHWYSRSSNAPLARVGLQNANVYGVRDLHGLVWEWTGDASSLLVDVDNRKQGDADKAKFCGAGALSMRDRNNYAVLMRVAMLSSLTADDVTANLGFRCAK
ncbi:formylglycine-generating enzyme family protein [Lysobacter pythonis]|uniref:Formylglycine-generating enzyme family protein n=1 Tax=Solilutibacter pythonis TaxID=2483112 RepID=A0A3M2HRG2_9GAMM|nr:formylglycine-generating enzyme family protein [Lysobacter pythonis]RMH90925.1 formylglycine-generating enzyme family protein [Lysobacter pythonis]